MQDDIQKDPEVDILDDLDELDKAIIRYKIDGLKDTQIAEKVAKSRGTIYKRLKKIKVQQAIQELQRTALEILVNAQSDAARTLRQIMKTGTDENKIRACKEILKGVLSDKVDISGSINTVYLDNQDKEL